MKTVIGRRSSSAHSTSDEQYTRAARRGTDARLSLSPSPSNSPPTPYGGAVLLGVDGRVHHLARFQLRRCHGQRHPRSPTRRSTSRWCSTATWSKHGNGWSAADRQRAEAATRPQTEFGRTLSAVSLRSQLRSQARIARNTCRVRAVFRDPEWRVFGANGELMPARNTRGRRSHGTRRRADPATRTVWPTSSRSSPRPISEGDSPSSTTSTPTRWR